MWFSPIDSSWGRRVLKNVFWLIWTNNVVIISLGYLSCHVLFRDRGMWSQQKLWLLSNLSWQAQILQIFTNPTPARVSSEIHLIKVGQHHNHLLFLHISRWGDEFASGEAKTATTKTTFARLFDRKNRFSALLIRILGTFNTVWSTWWSISNWYI